MGRVGKHRASHAGAQERNDREGREGEEKEKKSKKRGRVSEERGNRVRRAE